MTNAKNIKKRAIQNTAKQMQSDLNSLIEETQDYDMRLSLYYFQQLKRQAEAGILLLATKKQLQAAERSQ